MTRKTYVMEIYATWNAKVARGEACASVSYDETCEGTRSLLGDTWTCSCGEQWSASEWQASADAKMRKASGHHRAAATRAQRRGFNNRHED